MNSVIENWDNSVIMSLRSDKFLYQMGLLRIG